MPIDRPEALPTAFAAAWHAHPAGPHQVETLLQAVLTRGEGGWLIRAAENVTLTNPRTGEPMLRQELS